MGQMIEHPLPPVPLPPIEGEGKRGLICPNWCETGKTGSGAGRIYWLAGQFVTLKI